MLKSFPCHDVIMSSSDFPFIQNECSTSLAHIGPWGPRSSTSGPTGHDLSASGHHHLCPSCGVWAGKDTTRLFRGFRYHPVDNWVPVYYIQYRGHTCRNSTHDLRGSRHLVRNIGEYPWGFNTLWPRQNERHFPDDIFKWIFLNENVSISINISLIYTLTSTVV